MSTTIDQRVVEMRFDNKQFESNVKTSMSTIDKLKQKLNFKGATKGLEDVSNAAKKVDMSGLSSAVETVQTRFSALQVVGVTALANITNSAINAGKRIVSALTIDPILSGFQEYETQMNAVQTILANTQSKGTTIDDVTAALDELNKYADQTIYNFTEMTRNIGTFTAAGVDLDKSVTSIKGIANLAAVSGSNAHQASTAMYQLSQALAAGRVSLMDWNSVVNAGMGGELFQNALKRTAEQMGTNVDALIEKYGSFRESLTEGQWLTAEVLTETLTQLSGAYTEADLIAQGYSEKQAKEIVQLAETAVSAATDVKTFTQLWDTMKEAAQSGWAQTWQIIIGDFEEAKAFFTELSNLFGPIIQGMSDARNNLLEGALGSNWDKMIKQINDAGVATEDFTAELEKTVRAAGGSYDAIIERHGSLAQAFMDGALSGDYIIDTLKRMGGVTNDAGKSTEEMTGKLEYFQKVVNDVWMGDYKNGTERIEALTKAGYDYAEVQNLVNKTVDGHKLTLEDLTDVQLKSIGYTDEEVTKLRELAEQAEKTGTPLNDLIDNLTKPSGRELLLDSVLNILKSIINSASAVGKAWREIFPAMQSSQLYGFIEGLHSLTEAMMVDEEVADKITRTFRGLFSILDIITTILGGGVKIAFEVLSTVLGAFNLDILDATAFLGDMLYNFRNFLLDNELVTGAIELLSSGIVALIDFLKDLGSAFMQLDFVQQIMAHFEVAKEVVDGFIQGVKDGLISIPDLIKIYGPKLLEAMKNIGQDAISGLANGLKEGITRLPQILIQIGQTILNTIKDVLGIHSPSTEMEAIGEFSIQGLVNGFVSGVGTVLNAVKDIALQIVSTFSDILGSIDWGKIIAVGLSAGFMYGGYKMIGIFEAFSAPFEGIGSVLSGVGSILEEVSDSIGKTFKSLSKMMNAKAFSMKADGIKNIAIALAILAGSVFLLAQLDAGKLFTAVGALALLAVVIGALSVAVGKFGVAGPIKLGGFALAMIGISTSLLIVASALKKLQSLNPDSLGSTVASFLVIIGSMMGILAVYGKMVKGDAAANISKVGSMMIKLSISLLLMVAVIKLISGLSAGELTKGGLAILAFAGIVSVLTLMSAVAGNSVSKIGSMMIKLAVALGLMVIVIKLISGLSPGELIKGGLAITAFVGIIGTLAIITNMASPIANKLGTTLLAMSASMLILTGIMMLISTMSVGDIVKGGLAIAALASIVGYLAIITSTYGKDAPRIASTLLAMSVSIGILAGVAAILSLIDIAGLAKGIVAVGLLAGIMAILTMATRNAQSVTGTVVAMSVSIAVMAAAVAGLSFIDPARLTGATLALSILMGMFAIVVQSTSDIKTSMSTLIAMTAAIAVLGGVVYALSTLPIESVLSSTAALSTMLLSFSASMKILSTMGTFSAKSLLTIGVMGVIVAGLAFVLLKLSDLKPENSIGTAAALVTLLTGLAGVTAVLALVGKLGAGAALQGALALDAVILVVGGLMAGIGALATYFPQLEEFVNKGIGLLEAVGRGIGSFVGGIVGGVLSGITSSFPDIAADLSGFMENLTPFIDGAKSIDPSMMDGVQALAQTILILTAANVIDSLTSWFTGGSSLTKFAQELVPFGEAMQEFSTTIAGMDGNLVANAATAGKTMAEMAATIPNSGGVVEFFTGANDMTEFAKQLIPFGEAMVGFGDSVKGLDANAVTNAATAGKALTELADTVPNTGGLLEFLAGNNDLSTFGEQLVPFGEAITAFSQSVVGLDAEAVTTAATAGEALTKLSDTIPNTGGLVSFFTGDNDMATFGQQLAIFGMYFKMYSDYVKDVDAGIITTTANAAQSLVTLADTLPENKLFTNETTLDEFGSQLSEFGGYFASYYNSISAVDIGTLYAAVTEVGRLLDMATRMNDIDMDGMGSFGQALVKLGNTGIDNFIATFTNASSRVYQAASDMMGYLVNGATSRKGDFTNLFSTMVEDVLTVIKGKYPAMNMAGQTLMVQFVAGIQLKQFDLTNAFALLMTQSLNMITVNNYSFYTAGSTLMLMLISGVKSMEAALISSFRNPIIATLTEIRNNYTGFYNAGEYLVQGFIAGMDAHMGDVKRAARRLAREAYEAAMDELDAHSPSRLFEEVGSYVPLGFARGISHNERDVESSANSMANTAIVTVRDAISKVADYIENGIDSEPTIRPVLDLSGVESGASKLNTMFSRNSAMSISNSMNRSSGEEIQNGDATSSRSGNVYTFTQNNYSPKALSRIEIYRQTKNQFSAMERMV